MKAPLLGLSLAANVVLAAGVGWLAFRPGTLDAGSSPVVPGTGPSQTVATAAGVSPALTVSTPAFPESASWRSPTDVDAWLRAINAPPKVRYAAAQFILARKYRPLGEASRFPPNMKRWQRGASAPTPGQREKQADLWRQQEEEIKQLLGADYERARYDERAAARAGLSLEKYAAIERIRQDYAQIRMMQIGDGRIMWDQRGIGDEMAADVTKILTPQEYQLYQAFESREAEALQGAMAGLDIDDETYLRAYRAVTEARAENPRTRPSLGPAELQSIEKAVGPEIARHIAMGQDGNFREFDKVYSPANLASAARYEKYLGWQEFKETLGRLQAQANTGQLNGEQQATLRSAYDRLTAGLSPAARAEFDRTRTGAFMSRTLAKPTP